MRNAQLRSVRTVAYCAFFIAYCGLFSCGPKVEETEEFEVVGGIPRLAKYYDAIENGDTLFKVIPIDTFTNQNGGNYVSSDLRGNIGVVQIFFASCKGICPVITNNMVAVQKEFKGNANVKLLSLTVDPARDSVSVLKDYCAQFSVDSVQWSVVTGDKKKLYDFIRYGLQLPDVAAGNGDEEDFIHSDQLVLVDRNGIIRGYYGGTDTAQVRMLKEDIHILLNQK